MSLFEYERTGNADELIRILRESETESVREKAARVLGRLDEHDDRNEIITALVDAAQDDDSGAVVVASIDSLEEQGQDALEQLLTRMADVEFTEDTPDRVKANAFVKALGSDIAELRIAAVNALAEMDQSEAVPHLQQRFQDPDPRVRARAARACGMMEDPRATDGLVSLLEDPKASVRKEAADALGRIGNRQALAALLEMYDDDSETVRKIAVSAFGKFESEQPVNHLVEALDDDLASVRGAAVVSLIELLSNVPTEQGHEIRESIVEELVRSETESVVGPLVEILKRGRKASQRRNTAWLLGRVLEDDSNRDAIDALLASLREGEQMTRQFAATSLGNVGGTYVKKELLAIAMNDDEDVDTRAQAIFALGSVGDEETAEQLEGLIDRTENEVIRKRCFSALSKLGGIGEVSEH